MIKKLQIKFVIIHMTMVTTMLIVILGLIYNFTERNLEMENINMMKSIATNPFQLGRPNEPSEELRLPFFYTPSWNGRRISLYRRRLL